LSRNLKLSSDSKAITTSYDSDLDELILDVVFNNEGTVNE